MFLPSHHLCRECLHVVNKLWGELRDASFESLSVVAGRCGDVTFNSLDFGFLLLDRLEERLPFGLEFVIGTAFISSLLRCCRSTSTKRRNHQNHQ